MVMRWWWDDDVLRYLQGFGQLDANGVAATTTQVTTAATTPGPLALTQFLLKRVYGSLKRIALFVCFIDEVEA